MTQQDNNTILLERLNEKNQTQDEYNQEAKGTSPSQYQALQAVSFINYPVTEYIQPSDYQKFYQNNSSTFSYYSYN